MKHPAFRVRNILHLDPHILDELCNQLIEATHTLPFVAIPEICGSYAIGCARIESDIDINLAAKNWDEQVHFRRLWEDKSIERAFKMRLKPFVDAYSMRIEVAPCCPDNKPYNVVYDVIENKLYGKQGNFSLKWHPYQFKWIKGEPKVSGARFIRDEYKDLVKIWRDKYKSNFIEMELRKESLFRKCFVEKGSGSPFIKRWLP